MNLTLTGAHIVTPRGTVDGWLRVTGNTIGDIGTGPAPPGPAVDVSGRWIVPGFVDIHCHGGGGGSFTDLDLDQGRTAVRTHRAHGTTTMLASLVSAPVPDLANQVSALHELTIDGLIAGIHLEGPFLSRARCGAHDTTALRPPDRASIDRLIAAGRGSIRMVTLAPELENATTAIRQLSDAETVSAVGHTDATTDHVAPAIDAGATVATHLFNGMRPLHHREPGPVGALLDDERVTVELICDLVHLHPTVVRLAARHAGTARTAAITDAISAAAADDGTYELGSAPVTVTDGQPRLPDGSLAGSTLTMDAALRGLVHHCGLTVGEAVAATATTPARVLGLSDRIGAIAPGMSADLVVLDDHLHVHGVMREGTWVSTSAPHPPFPR